jgi:hypothetical protein
MRRLLAGLFEKLGAPYLLNGKTAFEPGEWI